MNKVGMKGKFTSNASTLQAAYDECCRLVGPFVGSGYSISILQTGSRPTSFSRTYNGTVVEEWETDFEWTVEATDPPLGRPGGILTPEFLDTIGFIRQH